MANIETLTQEELIENLRKYGVDDFDRQILIAWGVADVRGERPDLNDEQCMDVLQMVHQKRDATMGVTWDTLRYWADTLYPRNANKTGTEDNKGDT